MRVMKLSLPLRNALLLSLCTLGMSLSAGAQQEKQSTLFKAALADYKLLRYSSAARQFDEVLARDSSNVPALEMIADSYRKLKNYDEALFWYGKLAAQKEIKPEWALYHAEALANKEQYEQSERWYRRYQVLMPAERRAQNIIKNESRIKQLGEDKGDWKVMYTNLNTGGAEYSPVYYKKGIIFSSNRKTGKLSKNVFGWDQTPYTDLYYVADIARVGEVSASDMAEIESSKGKNDYKLNDDDTEFTANDTKTLGQYDAKVLADPVGVRLSKEIGAERLKKRINSRFHEGPAVVLPEGSLMFTRNNFYKGNANRSRQGVNKLKLFTATGTNWTKIQAFPYNDDEYSVGHPAVNKDGSVLVFTSDMPGGYGGTDLYYSVRTSTGRPWGKPVNLGPRINTEGNEMFPYFDKGDKLYFSSTGYAGLGGLDIFEVGLKEMKAVAVPRNLGAPMNSPGDDFGFIITEDGKSGFFSSNRSGNDDIYKFQRNSYKVDLRGLVTDARTRLPIPDAKVYLRYADGVDTLTSNRAGSVSRELFRETDYEVVVQKPGYVGMSTFITTAGIDKDSILNLPLRLSRAEVNQQWVLNHCDSLKRAFAVENIYYDLDKFYIRSESYAALDHIAGLMRANPNMEVLTSSHTDTRASGEYNRQLSMNRGNAARSYLMTKGISGNRIRVLYYGKSRLVNRCLDGVPCSEAEQQLNRRTEFEIILNGVNLSAIDCNR